MSFLGAVVHDCNTNESWEAYDDYTGVSFDCNDFDDYNICTMDGTKGAGFSKYFKDVELDELRPFGATRGYHALNCPQCGCGTNISPAGNHDIKITSGSPGTVSVRVGQNDAGSCVQVNIFVLSPAPAANESLTFLFIFEFGNFWTIFGEVRNILNKEIFNNIIKFIFFWCRRQSNDAKNLSVFP